MAVQLELEVLETTTSMDMEISSNDTSFDLTLDSEIEVVSLDYNLAINKPQINSVTLQGNKTSSDLGLASASDIKIKTIKIGEEALVPVNQVLTLPVASAVRAGLVKSSSNADCITVAEDGTMSVNSVEISKLYIAEENDLVLNCGKSI